MTISDRALRGPVLRTTAGQACRAPASATKLGAASALFRLLSDSALSRAALSACGLPIALADALSPAHPLTYVNPAFEALFGYRSGEAHGEPLDALVPFSHDPANRVSGDAPARVHTTARRKDGTPLVVELAIGPLYDADGRLTHWVLAFSDRTELQTLRAELSALRAGARAS
ncbi:MAG TPA: PAS domain-containing protein [Burkholderiales bacterium]|nr:PAS domain-containing protein [Burkholderiales bacterium]